MKSLYFALLVLSIASANVVIEKLLSQEDPALVHQFGEWMLKHRKMDIY